MSVLAFKAIDYGAEQIPDKFFEKIPGGFFKPPEKKKGKDSRDKKDRERHQSEQRSSRRDRSDHSDYSANDDTDYEYERNRRKQERRRRAKSAGRTSSRSPSRGRRAQHSSDLDGQHSDTRDMAHAEQGGPYFPPPPSSEYRPYNPQEYATGSPQGDYRASSPGQPYGYPAQPAAAPRHNSASAARYTPGPGYAPSPPVNTNIPAQPIAPGSPYAPYNPSEYASNAGGYQAPGNAYPSPPPISRQRSNSQPANPPYPTYVPPSADQRMAAYDSSRPSSRRDSTKPRREHRHRARSADTRSSHKDYDPDQRRDSSRMTKMRERFDEGFMREPSGLAAAVGGALAGGFAGNKLGRSKLTTLAGAAAGALGGRAIADKRSKSRGPRSTSRSRSRSRSRTRRDGRDRERSRNGGGIRARSKSIIDRFRSKSRGPEDRDSARGSRMDRYDDRHDRPDHGYDRGRDDYDSFSSESDGDGSPVNTRRHRKRRDY